MLAEAVTVAAFVAFAAVVWAMFSPIGGWLHRRRHPPPPPGAPVDAEFRVVGEGRWEPLKRWWAPKRRVVRELWLALPYVIIFGLIGLGWMFLVVPWLKRVAG